MDKKFRIAKNKFFLYIFSILLLFGFNSAYSEPLISTVGTIINGQAVTITGSDFGSKTTAAPIAWTGSEIDAGIIGNNASLTGFSQISVSEVNAKFSGTQSHTGKSILFDYDRTDNWSQFMLDMGSGQTTVFVSMWVRLEYSDTCDKYQWKSWRLRSGTDYAHNNGTTILNDWWYSESSESWFNSGNVQSYYNSGTWGGGINGTPDQMLFDTWQRIEGYYVASTPSTANGVTWLRRVGRSGDMLASSSLITRNSNDPLWRYIRFGQAYSNPTACGTETGGLKVYLDDIYVDNTQARIEIGNNSIWSNCTHREIQIPSAWSSTSVTATVNQGSFTDGQQAWVFVVDSNGEVSSGKEITFGESSSSNVPVAPTNLEIQ